MDEVTSNRRRRQRLRARRVMRLVALVCALAALGLGAYELHAEGVSQFLYRAPGIGASPSDPQSSSSPAGPSSAAGN